MKVRELKNAMDIISGEDVDARLTSISHWIKKLNDEGSYMAVSKNEMKTLRALGKLNIISVKDQTNKLKAVLTKEGKELYWDFLGHGYYPDV